MFSGKTEELIRRLRRAEIAGKKVILFKPLIDDRYNSEVVTTHDGRTMCSHNITWSRDMVDYVVKESPVVVGIDEAQFLDEMIDLFIDQMIQKGIKVIVSGLDKDFSLQNFGKIPRLMVMADRVDKLTAVCNKCGADDASFTQRLLNGKPAPFDGPTILVGGMESYEARCRGCFERG